MKKFTLVIMLLAASKIIAAQQVTKDLAKEKAEQAIKLEDNEGKYDEAIKLLQEAKKLDPENEVYTYELGYAYYHKKEYKLAIQLLEPLENSSNSNPRIYQLAGNAYDLSGDSLTAIATYKKGLIKFPNSGELHLESGNMYMFAQKYDSALYFYEKGLALDPEFPSNYYWASTFYCNSSEKVWGMIYGEIFLNLEPNTERSDKISKLLYDTYKESIKLTSDTSMSVSFSKINTIAANSTKLPFGTGVYEMNLLLAIAVSQPKKIDLASLNTIRSNFVQNYYEKNLNQNYPNILFDFQKQMKDAGVFESYNYWLLSSGDLEGFKKWKSTHEADWKKFEQWISKDHQLTIDEQHHFYRNQYDD